MTGDESEACCDYRDHTYGYCACPEHPRSELHPFGGHQVPVRANASLTLGLRGPLIPDRDGEFVLVGEFSVGVLLWDDPALDYEMRDHLVRAAEKWVAEQNQGASFRWVSLKAMLTRDPAVAAATPLSHPCDQCREDRAGAVRLLESDNDLCLVLFHGEYELQSMDA